MAAPNLIEFPTGAGARIGKRYEKASSPWVNTKPRANDAAAVDRDRARVNDYFTNAAARMGWGSPSVAEGADYNLVRLSYNYWLMITLYRNHWISRRIVETTARDMVKAWPKLTSEIDPKDLTAIDKAIRVTRTKAQVLKALRWARLFGGAGALIVVEGQEKHLDEPLDVDAVPIGGYRGLIPFDRWTGIYPSSTLSTDITRPLEFNLPEYYEVGAPQGSGRFRVHASRILRFCGPDVPTPEYEAQMCWGISVLEPVYESIRKLDNISWNLLSTSFRSNIIGMKVPMLAQMLSGLGANSSATQAFGSRMQAFNEMLSNQNMVLLEKDGGFEQIQQNMSGWDSVLQQFQMDVSGASQIPMTRLFGRTATGLGQSNDQDERVYEELIAQEQEDQFRPQLDKLYPVICMSTLGEVPKDLDLTFPSVRVLTEEEKATLAKNTGDNCVSLFGAGIFTKPMAMKELKQSSDVTGFGTNITDDDIEAAEEAEKLMPSIPGEGGLPGEPPQEGEPEPGGKKKLIPENAGASAARKAKTAAEEGKKPKGDAALDSMMIERQFAGIQCVIEVPAGGIRALYDGEGKCYYNRILDFAYGFIRDTIGRDGDAIDVILGPDQNAPTVFVVDMLDLGPNVDARQDEDKICLGFKTAAAAKCAFIDMYQPSFFGGMEEVPLEEFKQRISKPLTADTFDAEWQEGKHPRAENGQFGEGSSGGSGGSKVRSLDPHKLILRETHQTPEDLSELREAVGNGPIETPIMAYRDDGGNIHVIDGHHRVLIAREKGLSVPGIVIPEKEYQRLKADGNNDTEIKRAYAVSLANARRDLHAVDTAASIRDWFKSKVAAILDAFKENEHPRGKGED